MVMVVGSEVDQATELAVGKVLHPVGHESFPKNLTILCCLQLQQKRAWSETNWTFLETLYEDQVKRTQHMYSFSWSFDQLLAHGRLTFGKLS